MTCDGLSGSAVLQIDEVEGDEPVPAYLVVYVQSYGFVSTVFGIKMADPGSVLFSVPKFIPMKKGWYLTDS